MVTALCMPASENEQRIFRQAAGRKVMGFEMANCSNPNKSIGCTVTQCEHHCGGQNYCTLDKITVGTHEMNPTVIECTDCESFKLKK